MRSINYGRRPSYGLRPNDACQRALFLPAPPGRPADTPHVLQLGNFAWPWAELAVMGAEGAVNILNKKEIAAADDPDKLRQKLIDWAGEMER